MDSVTINEKHIIENRGKKYVLYAGLLDAAHRNGLGGITTKLVQVGDDSNGGITIVHATVILNEQTYTGLGEVGKRDTPIALQNPVRMAETRSKARALRDALNASEYELEGDGEDRPEPEHPKRTTDPFPRAEPYVEPETPLPVRSLGSVMAEAQQRWPEKVRQGAQQVRDARAERTTKVDDRPEQDRADVYQGDKSAAPRPTEYDKDPAKLESAHNAWDELWKRAKAVGIEPEAPDLKTWESVSLMRAAWAKLNRQVRAASADQKPGEPVVDAPTPEPPVDDAPPPVQE